MSQLKLENAVFEIGLSSGVGSIEDVVAWADSISFASKEALQLQIKA